MTTHPLVRFFSPDPRHDGVRPIQVWGLRLFFLLMLGVILVAAKGSALAPFIYSLF